MSEEKFQIRVLFEPNTEQPQRECDSDTDDGSVESAIKYACLSEIDGVIGKLIGNKIESVGSVAIYRRATGEQIYRTLLLRVESDQLSGISFKEKIEGLIGDTVSV